MKPRLKNVTAEDVFNSLYYLHFDTPNDIFLVNDVQDGEDVERAAESPKVRIPRKPLPDDALPPALPKRPPFPEESRRIDSTISGDPNQPNLGGVTSDQVPIDGKPPLPLRPPPNIKAPVIRRPLGSRPFQPQPQVNRKPLPGEENIPVGTNIQPLASEIGVERGCSQNEVRDGNESLTGTKAVRQDSNPSSVSTKAPFEETFSITLIRRDPTSGAQWNIGNLNSHRIYEDRGSSILTKPGLDKPWSSVSVRLSTLGYRQFLRPQAICHIGVGSASAAEEPETSGPQICFHREVHMEWPSFWERTFKQHRRRSSDQPGGRVRSNTDVVSEELRDANLKRGQASSTRNGAPECGFLSPWDGRCDFSTGNGGRTLKCKHTLPSSTMYTTAASLTGASAAVSELRFNLPSVAIPNTSAKFAGSGRVLKPRHIRNKLPSDFAKPSVSPKPDPTSYAALYPSEDEDGLDDGLDDGLGLSLGREKAGGGNRGKRAKLGKLIVHDEGLKMLDLVVAANMGVWWGIWER